MATLITKEAIEHLAQLARLELTETETEKLLHDLEGILNYFNELQKVDTKNVAPMNGGTLLANVFREDEEREDTNKGKGKGQFPESEGGALRVPAIFDTAEE